MLFKKYINMLDMLLIKMLFRLAGKKYNLLKEVIMKKNILPIFIIIILSFQSLYAQNQTFNETGLIYLRSNLEVLASDLFEGRETATRGEQLAALFISKELAKYGVKPFGDDGTYYQFFDLMFKTVEPETELTIISSKGTSKVLKLGDDLYFSKEKVPSDKYKGNESNLVFAGYGITAADYNYNDYSGIDVKGKVVLLQSGAPTINEKEFSKEDEKRFGDRNYKIENANHHGAVGVLLIPGGKTLKYWEYIKKHAVSPSVSLITTNEEDKGAIPAAMLSEESVKYLLFDEENSYDEILVASENGKSLSGFDLTKKIIFKYKINTEIKQARNVIGIIEGKNDQLKNEYVVLTAHYDHEGIVGGEIYNGADDNGSGTVAILEAGRRLSLLKDNKRSILIVFHAGEEKGLLGSKYLTKNSEFMSEIVSNINIDMVGREETESIYSIGSGKLSTELYELVERVNSETVRFELDYTFDDPNDPNNYYYRSDHYNYAKQNIPIVFFYDHMTEDYHKSTDDVDKINFEKLEKVSTLITELALRIANLDHRLKVDKPAKDLSGPK
jgi:Zn-dependent M28 family amino/carboxypeptidase